MSIKKLSFMLLSALSLAALLNGCGSSNKEGSPGGVERVADEGVCIHCHSTTVDHLSGTTIVGDYFTSVHNQDAVGCEGCHGGGSQHNGVGPFQYPNPLTAGRCVHCHTAGGLAAPQFGNNTSLFQKARTSGFVGGNCAHCHTSGGNRSIHGALNPTDEDTKDCISCHDVAAPNHGPNLVNDNNGVRNITAEFQKWSHHVTGVTLNAAHCAACHLEGTVVDGKIKTDTTKHMVDAKIHLRNADNDADIAWDPAAPSFTNMDNFCLSCHDADGATSSVSRRIQDYINKNNITGKTASAINPFGDTISNQYDKLQRPAVVDAKSQFATTNPSHHAVRGKKYTGRTRTAGDSRVIADVAGFTSNSSATLPGARSTIYDAGKFQADYTTLADAAGEPTGHNGGTALGDDSTLHCADCHTVGQYSKLAPGYGGRYNNAVIGAHGSNNEYLLRNNIGTDQRHQGVETTGGTAGVASQGYGTKPYLVCFNCHAFTTYGSVGSSTGIAGMNHAGEYANSVRCNGPNNTVMGEMTGEARLRSTSTQTDSTGSPAGAYGQWAMENATTPNITFGNVFGIQCNNCHNSGTTAGNIFGGIHGAKDTTYTDGMGNTTKHVRFMPGLGNVMYVPGTKGGNTIANPGALATYAVYSGNRDGGDGATTKTDAASKAAVKGIMGQTFTQLPVRTVVPGVSPAASTLIDGKTVPSQVMPYNNALPSSGIKTGSYQYLTGGASSDLNWEQKSAQPIAGQFDFQAKAMGCYTLAPSNVYKLNKDNTTDANGDVAGNGRNAYPATNNITAGAAGPDGTTTMFDNWGGCDDHNGAQGAGTAPFRKVLRKISY